MSKINIATFESVAHKDQSIRAFMNANPDWVVVQNQVSETFPVAITIERKYDIKCIEITYLNPREVKDAAGKI